MDFETKIYCFKLTLRMINFEENIAFYLYKRQYPVGLFEKLPNDSLKDFKLKIPKNTNCKTPREEHFSSLEEKDDCWIAYIFFEDWLKLNHKNHLNNFRKISEYLEFMNFPFFEIRPNGNLKYQEPDSFTLLFTKKNYFKDKLEEHFDLPVTVEVVSQKDSSKYFEFKLNANKINQLHKEVSRKPFRRLTKENVLFYLDDLGIHGINCEDIEMVGNLPFYDFARVKLSNESYEYFVKNNQKIKGKIDILSSKDNTKYIDISKLDQDFE